MIRLFIFTIGCLFIALLVVYIITAFIKRIILVLMSNIKKSVRYPEHENTPKAKEEYQDVKDAKFVELPKKDLRT